MLSCKVPNVPVTTGMIFFFLFWRAGGVSYDVRISAGYVEGTVLNVQLKCILFPPPSLPISLYSRASEHYCARHSLCPTRDFHGKFLKTCLWNVFIFSFHFLSILTSSAGMFKGLKFLFC